MSTTIDTQTDTINWQARAEAAEAEAAEWKFQARKHEGRLKQCERRHASHDTKYDTLLRDISRHIVTELKFARYLQVNPEGVKNS